MVKYEKDNDGYAYFVVFIDIFTRYLYTAPLKTLQGREMVACLKDIFDKYTKPTNLRTDMGVEFKNRLMSAYLKKESVNHIFTYFLTKANYAERVIKTLKLKLIKHMTHKESHRWIDVLEKFTKGYSDSYHRGIKMTPNQARLYDKYQLWNIQYNTDTKKIIPKTRVRYKYKNGDRVRISYLKKTFDREYSEKWSTEIFTIVDKKLNQDIPMYQIKDYNNDIIDGYFYEPELQLVIVDSDTVYKIEKVIKSHKKRGVSEVLVKWKGWPSKFNSWIKKTELKDIQK